MHLALERIDRQRLFTTTNDELQETQERITRLFSEDRLEAAFTHIFNVASKLSRENRSEELLVLQLYYLKKLAACSNSKKISMQFRLFVFEAYEQIRDRLENSNYYASFTKFLYDEVSIIRKHLGNNYEKEVEFLDVAIEFFKFIECNFANVLELIKADIYQQRGRQELIPHACNNVFSYLHELSCQEHYLITDTELLHLKEALERLVKLPAFKHQKLFVFLLEFLFNSENTSNFQSLVVQILDTKDHQLFLTFFYIFSVLYNGVKKREGEVSIVLVPAAVSAIKEQTFKAVVTQLDSMTDIFLTIKEQNLDILRKLIEANLHLHARGPQNTTPLQYAISTSYYEGAKLLMSLGKVDVNETDTSHQEKVLPPPIYMAIDLFAPTNDKRISLLGLLLEYEVSVNKNHNLKIASPLYYAITKEKEEAATILLAHNALLTDSEIETLCQPSKPTEGAHRIFKKLYTSVRRLRAIIPSKYLEGSSKQIIELHAVKGNSLKTPIFCPYTIEGNITSYRLFAGIFKTQDSERPIYGIMPPPLTKKSSNPKDTLKEKAEECIQAMRTKQPVGPYALFAQGFAGILALEIARLLHEQDDEVTLLATFESLAPQLLNKLSTEHFAGYLLSTLGKVIDQLVAKNFTIIPISTLKELSKQEQIEKLLPPEEAIANVDKKMTRRMIRSNLLAMLNYKTPPAARSGNPFITCLRPRQLPPDLPSDLGWLEETDRSCVVETLVARQDTPAGEEALNHEIVKILTSHFMLKRSDVFNRRNALDYQIKRQELYREQLLSAFKRTEERCQVLLANGDSSDEEDKPLRDSQTPEGRRSPLPDRKAVAFWYSPRDASNSPRQVDTFEEPTAASQSKDVSKSSSL